MCTPLELTVLGLVRERGADPELIHNAILQGLYTWDSAGDVGPGKTRIRRYTMTGGTPGSMKSGSDKSVTYIEGPKTVTSLRDVEEALVSVRRKLAALSKLKAPEELNRNGKRATIPRHVTRTPKEEQMSNVAPPGHEVPAHSQQGGTGFAPGPREGGFAALMAQQAEGEAQAVLEELVRLRFRADQVVRVMRALSLVVPRELAALTDATVHFPDLAQEARDGRTPVVPAGAVELGARGAAESPADPEPAPAPGPDPAGAQEAPVRRRKARGRRAPKHLSGMPAVKTRVMTTTIARAERQKKILELVEDGRRTVVTQELMPLLEGLTADQIAAELRALAEADLIRLTGVNRFPAGHPGDRGKASKEYAPKVVAVPEPTATHVRETMQEHGIEPTGLNPQALAKVRDEVRTHPEGEPFTADVISRAVSCGLDLTKRCLVALMEREVVTGTPVEDPALFAYQKPKDPGAAAKADMARRANGNGNGEEHAAGFDQGAVAGTGKRVRSSNADVNRLLAACEKAGAVVTHPTTSHFSVTYKGKRCVVHGTPKAGSRTLKDTETRLKRIGIPL